MRNPLLVFSYYEDIWIDLDQLPTDKADIFAIVQPQLARAADLSRSTVFTTFKNVKRVNLWHKLLHALKFYAFLPHFLATKKVFLFVAPPYFHFLALPVLRLFGKKVLTICGDAYSEIAFEPLWQASAFRMLLRKLAFPLYWLSEYTGIRFSNNVFAVSTYLADKYCRWTTVKLAPNGAPVTDIEKIPAKPAVGEPYVYYMGGLLKWRGIDLLVNAFGIVKRAYGKPLKLVIVGGEKGEREHYPELRNADSDVVFTGRLPHAEAIGALKAAKIAVLPNRKSLLSGTISSIKVFEHIAACVPQVCTDTGDHADWVRKTGTGIVVNDSAEEIADAILQLLTDEDAHKQCKEQCARTRWEVDSAVLREPIIQAVAEAV
jgi:glycosyltransferase involved in cell wall biosynthesis